MGFWADVKRFVRMGFRLLVALFMLVVVVGAAYWAWSSWQSKRMETRVSVAKGWTVTPLPFKRPLEVRLKTRCADSRLYYQLDLSPKTEGAVSRLQPNERAAFVEGLINEVVKFQVSFLDKDGFRVITFDTPISSFQRNVDDEGSLTGLSAIGDESCNGLAYERAESASVSWFKK